jgi:hypothetical protein
LTTQKKELAIGTVGGLILLGIMGGYYAIKKIKKTAKQNVMALILKIKYVYYRPDFVNK